MYEARFEIDRLFRDDLSRFAEARESMIHVFGMQNYADVMSNFAAGERYINRVWSASTDGYVDEVRMYLERAREQFREARRHFDELASRARLSRSSGESRIRWPMLVRPRLRITEVAERPGHPFIRQFVTRTQRFDSIEPAAQSAAVRQLDVESRPGVQFQYQGSDGHGQGRYRPRGSQVPPPRNTAPPST